MSAATPILEIRQTSSMGRGVFALDAITHGTLLVACEGWLATTSELHDDWHAMQVGADLWLCSNGDCLDECINHSCDPNAGFVTGEAVLYALRDIAAGEQIFWDYSTSLAELGWSLHCRCGSSRCRKIVRSWSELPPEDRTRLRPIALTFLRDPLIV